MAPVVIKKYGNRRLYDTGESRYVTLDELAERIRGGVDVRVIDDKSGDDLTQATLTQIILESRDAARMLPVPLLTQLVRLGDDALAEFFGRYVSSALEAYLHGKQAMAQLNPFAAMGYGPGEMFRMFGPAMGGYPPYGYPAPAPAAAPPPAPAPAEAAEDEIAAMRRDLEELRRAVAGASKPRRRKP